MRRQGYVKDLRGRVVKAPEYKPSGDQNPDGKAARRRRKQMERQLQKQVGPIELMDRLETSIRHSDVTTCDGCGLDATDACPHCQAATCGKCSVCEHGPQNLLAEVQHAADSSEVPRADRQDLAHNLIVDRCLDGGAIHTWTDDDGEIRQRYVPESELRFPVEQGKVTLGVDPGSPEGDMSTVAIRKGNTITILDEASQVPQHVWDEMGADVSRRINERIAAELGGGTPPPVNKVVTRKGRRMGLGLTRGILAAALLATMGTDKPKE